MNTNFTPNRSGTSSRVLVPAFPQSTSHHIKNVHTTTSDHTVINAGGLFGAQTAIQRAQAGQATAESANKAKSDFLADMSHEIRTPMGAIIGLTNILLATNLDNRQRQCLTVLLGSAEALMVMLKGLLDIGKIESRTIDLEYAPFNVNTLLNQIVGIMSVKAEEKGIGLALHYKAAPTDIFIGDSGRIRQIVLNLIGNAIKFTERGGVTLSFAADEERNGKRQIFISVSDTGIGIPEDKIHLIFDRFIQANPSIVSEYGGTGLGLSISKALAENMGGGISVTSVMGKGSTFALHLPLCAEAGETLAFRATVGMQPTNHEEQFP